MVSNIEVEKKKIWPISMTKYPIPSYNETQETTQTHHQKLRIHLHNVNDCWPTEDGQLN